MSSAPPVYVIVLTDLWAALGFNRPHSPSSKARMSQNHSRKKCALRIMISALCSPTHESVKKNSFATFGLFTGMTAVYWPINHSSWLNWSLKDPWSKASGEGITEPFRCSDRNVLWWLLPFSLTDHCGDQTDRALRSCEYPVYSFQSS